MLNAFRLMAQVNPNPSVSHLGEQRFTDRQSPGLMWVQQPSDDQFITHALIEKVYFDEDESQAKDSYEALQTVTPVFNAALEANIQALIHRYECESGSGIPPALRWKIQGQWKTNKDERLKAVLWVMMQLSAAETAAEAINQLACILERVEALAHQRAFESKLSAKLSLDPKLMRLTNPLAETCYGQPLLVSYGIRHVTLFQADGSVQIQCVTKPGTAVHYRKQAQRKGLVLLDKPGRTAQHFWTSR